MKKGFSLVELSIVLIIIALLVTGVSSGGKLINQAKLKSISNDYNSYKTAYNTFYLTYDVLPGDMSEANTLAFFGEVHSADTCTSDTYYAEDGVILGRTDGIMAFWHMKLAGLISGSYDGAFTKSEEIGITVGQSSYDDNAGFNFFTLGRSCNMWGYSSDLIYAKANKIVLSFGAAETASNATIPNSILKPQDAHRLDNKLDDGIPNSGKIMADHGYEIGSSQHCTSLSGYANSYSVSDGILSYMLTNDYVACRVMFEML